ncbi:MAG: N5-carboxyaminoimidazole ribonucleotide mutase [Methanomassiliicoccales archaeon PtaU1.Bin124]|nr:MAG: N5-carboxyaminoimidazole ribonucleotide mutase [Methanomassiliicoccales archaeon PtaU1.Bin124]
MNTREVLERLQRGYITLERAEQLLKMDFLENIGGHTIFDHAREARRGIPEIIFGERKSPEVVAEIVTRVMADRDVVLVSRASHEHLDRMMRTELKDHVRYVPEARMIVIDKRPERERKGRIGIITAGSSDRGVAEEARAVAESMGVEVLVSYDVGVAALHRLLTPLQDMIDKGVDCLIVVAGMEGALPTVVSGLVDVPVIGVPTSVGYGHGGGGQAALMGMLQTCSPGLSVVNIDNGVAAGATAALICRRCNRDKG